MIALAEAKPEPEGNISPPSAVLIAEDDPMFRRKLESWFKKWNYRVTAVENGQAAWEVLQKEDAPQLAILDWMMPGGATESNSAAESAAGSKAPTSTFCC